MAASEGTKNLSQEQNSCFLLPAGTDSPHCESCPATEVLMLKLPVLLRDKKVGGQYTVSCALHCLARYLCLGLHLPSAKWELAVELPSAQPLQAQGYHTTRGPVFRWGDSPGTCTGLEAVGLGAAAGWILLWLVKCEHHHHTTGSFCEQEHLQDFLSSTWCALQYPGDFSLFTCPLSCQMG